MALPNNMPTQHGYPSAKFPGKTFICFEFSVEKNDRCSMTQQPSRLISLTISPEETFSACSNLSNHYSNLLNKKESKYHPPRSGAILE